MSGFSGVSVVVEGPSDQGAARAILKECNLTLRQFYGGNGRPDIQKRIYNYNQAALISNWFVLADLDDISRCAGELAREWLPEPAARMRFRFAVVELEAWLLADAEAAADFLGVSEAIIPRTPDELPDAKQTLINIARRSRKRDIRTGLVPVEGSGARVGPTYTSDIQNFGEKRWRPAVAAERSPSLARCMVRLRELGTAIHAPSE